MITLRIRYNNIDKFDIEQYQTQYSSCLHFIYNRIYDSNNTLSEVQLRQFYDKINNKELISKWMFQCCIKEAKQIYSKHKTNKVIFGGKANFFNRLKSKISKEEYKANRLSPIYSIGEESKKGNRLFRIQNDMSIIFQPNRNTHYMLELIGIGNNRMKYISKLIELQNNRQIGITYKLDSTYIYISFDETKIELHKHNKIENRILALDLNPNYIGYSIVDWHDDNKYDIVSKGVYSFEKYNIIESKQHKLKLASYAKQRIHINNKRHYDIIDICKNIVDKAIHYKCQIIGIEDLNIKPSNRGKGTNFNKQCNNKWMRNLFTTNLTKRCNVNNIRLVKVIPNYSSFIGNIAFRHEELPDMILASLEIGRRAYEYNLQYIEKKKNKIKNIVFPKLEDFYDSYVKSLEEFNIKEKFSTWIEMYQYIKEAKIMYRFPFDKCKCLKVFRFKSSLCYILQ